MGIITLKGFSSESSVTEFTKNQAIFHPQTTTIAHFQGFLVWDHIKTIDFAGFLIISMLNTANLATA